MRVLYLEDHESLARELVRAMRDRGLDPQWCQGFDEAVAAAAGDAPSICVADHDLGDPKGRTGTDFLAGFAGHKVLCSGDPPRHVPDDVVVFTKARLADMLAHVVELAAAERVA